ncbi:MAG TPA: response regulator transcription factor [Planktothrix sp.]|jgi:two-component system response regulator QseB
MAKILFAEDDLDLAGRIELFLKHEHHNVEVVHDGLKALENLQYFKYELVILDWGLPNLTGLEICKKYREKGGTTPVLMLTGHDKIAEKEAGFDSGADDYLTKPFDVRELSARIRALLRRPTAFTGTQLKVRGIELDTSSYKVIVNGEQIQLAPKEFSLLEFLMKHAGKVVSPDQLLEHVWSSESDATSETIYTYIKTLRKKISPGAAKDSPIRTVHGLGYTIDA